MLHGVLLVENLKTKFIDSDVFKQWVNEHNGTLLSVACRWSGPPARRESYTKMW